MKVSISDSSISETKDLIEHSRRNRVVLEDGSFYLSSLIKEVSQHFNEFRVGIGRSVHALPAIHAKESSFFQALMEIYSNAIHHGRGNYVGVQAKDSGGITLLRFKGKTKEKTAQNNLFDSPESDNFRGYGLKSVRDIMAREEIDMRIVESPKSFVVELYMPNDIFSADSD